jgi:methylenetetrahydrofolate reductase (NADPH)
VIPLHATPSSASADVSAPPVVSFEFFPPKTEEATDRLWRSIPRLEPLAPRFVSVTYGAGGSTRKHTFETVCRIARETSLTAAAHLTCVGDTRQAIDDLARRYWQEGIRHIVALRGDPPNGNRGYTPHAGGYASTVDLIEGLKRITDFEISVSAFPEVHPEARSPDADLDYLKRKIGAGADRAITQYFFDVDVFFRFLERARATGIDVPIVPGIMPVFNFAKVAAFSAKCGASVPRWLADMFEGLDDDPETRRDVSVAQATQQCQALREQGIHEFHFFTLNGAGLTSAVCQALGLRPMATEVRA